MRVQRPLHLDIHWGEASSLHPGTLAQLVRAPVLCSWSCVRVAEVLLAAHRRGKNNLCCFLRKEKRNGKKSSCKDQYRTGSNF